jgi:hypothetical protein
MVPLFTRFPVKAVILNAPRAKVEVTSTVNNVTEVRVTLSVVDTELAISRLTNVGEVIPPIVWVAPLNLNVLLAPAVKAAFDVKFPAMFMVLAPVVNVPDEINKAVFTVVVPETVAVPPLIVS